jgi:RNA polymerase sigma-70 factor (ECF subfamily)
VNTRSLPLDDPDQLGRLLLDLEPRLIPIALRFSRDPEAARDIVQNAFEKVLRHGARFRGSSKVSTWIHRIVANEALMWLRSERRRSGLHRDGDDVFTELADPSRDPGDCAHHRRQLGEVGRALQKLSEEERDVVLCCALSGESYGDYGRRTDTHPSAVKSRAFRARRHLSRALEAG